MDTLSFVAEITKALALPLTILIVVMIFHRPLALLIQALRGLRLQYKDFQVILSEHMATPRDHNTPVGGAQIVIRSTSSRETSSSRRS